MLNLGPEVQNTLLRLSNIRHSEKRNDKEI